MQEDGHAKCRAMHHIERQGESDDDDDLQADKVVERAMCPSEVRAVIRQRKVPVRRQPPPQPNKCKVQRRQLEHDPQRHARHRSEQVKLHGS